MPGGQRGDQRPWGLNSAHPKEEAMASCGESEARPGSICKKPDPTRHAHDGTMTGNPWSNKKKAQNPASKKSPPPIMSIPLP